MKLVSVETPEKSVCKMTFSASAEELEAASNAVYERTRATYTIKGFAKGEADPEGFMAGIEEMTRSLISRYSQISEDAQKLFQAERVVIGKCPRCGEAVYEGKKTITAETGPASLSCGRMTAFSRNARPLFPRRLPPRSLNPAK